MTVVTEGLVSVVVVARDDRNRLPRAVRSALAQGPCVLEVVVVDDASTDGTDEVARELARQDPRVQVLVRDTSTGFPGAPRNQGLDRACGRYVLCVDSDDELEPGAVRALLEVAEREGADAVVGRTSRLNPSRGTTTPWMPWLFEELGTTTLRERPELVGDTILVDKLVRREVLGDVRFPEDILYEDVVLTAELATRLGTVVVTDVPLYRWYVRADDDDRSITNSRRVTGNLEDRLEANRRATEVLRAAGRDDLRHAKDRKVVDHDLPLVLRDLVDRDPDVGTAVVRALQPFVASLHPGVRASAEQPAAVVLAALARGDVDEVEAAAALGYRGHLTRGTTLVDGRDRWPGYDGPAGDVTALVEPLRKEGLVLFHQVQGLETHGDRLLLRVRTTAPAGAPVEEPVLGLLVVDRRRRRRVARAAAGHVHGDIETGLTWEAEVRLGRGLRRAELLGELDVRVTSHAHDDAVRWTLAVPEALVAGTRLETRGWRGRRVGRAYQTAKGNLSLRRTR